MKIKTLMCSCNQLYPIDRIRMVNLREGTPKAGEGSILWNDYATNPTDSQNKCSFNCSCGVEIKWETLCNGTIIINTIDIELLEIEDPITRVKSDGLTRLFDGPLILEGDSYPGIFIRGDSTNTWRLMLLDYKRLLEKEGSNTSLVIKKIEFLDSCKI